MYRKKCCLHCVHYMRGFYKTTQLVPGNVCGAKPKDIMKAKGVFPYRKYFYKTEPDKCCNDFEPWKD